LREDTSLTDALGNEILTEAVVEPPKMQTHRGKGRAIRKRTACLVTLDTTYSRLYDPGPPDKRRERTIACHIKLSHLMSQESWGLKDDDYTIPCVVLNPDNVRISLRNWEFWIVATLVHESLHHALTNSFGAEADQVDKIDNVEMLSSLGLTLALGITR